MTNLRRKDVFTTGQVASICKVAPRTVIKWFDSGRLKGYRIPSSQDRRIPRESLIQFLKENGMPLGELEEKWHKILLIGTESSFNHRIQELLPEGQDYRFEIANSSFEAGVLVVNFHPDTIVIDLTLGRSEAIQIASKLRKNDAYASALIIGLAGEDEAEPEQLLQYGFDIVFKRPFDIALLSKKIEKSR